jgi:hypothetical protein
VTLHQAMLWKPQKKMFSKEFIFACLQFCDLFTRARCTRLARIWCQNAQYGSLKTKSKESPRWVFNSGEEFSHMTVLFAQSTTARYFCNSVITYDDLEDMFPLLVGFQSLTALTVNNCWEDRSTLVWSHFVRTNQLRQLHIKFYWSTTANASSNQTSLFNSIKQMTMLEDLALNVLYCDVPELDNLTLNLSCLTEFAFEWCTTQIQPVCLQSIMESLTSSVRKLKLRNIQEDQTVLSNVCERKVFLQLTELDLSLGKPLEFFCVQSMAISMPNLTSLRVSDRAIKYDAVQFICTHLMQLRCLKFAVAEELDVLIDPVIFCDHLTLLKHLEQLELFAVDRLFYFPDIIQQIRSLLFAGLPCLKICDLHALAS